MIVESYNKGEDLLWSNKLGFISPDSPDVDVFTRFDVNALTLPIGGRWMTREEFNNCHEARLCLEGLPCPVCTENLTIMDFQHILKSINQLAEHLYGHPINHDNEDEDALWWSELEDWAVRQFRCKYYEDMEDVVSTRSSEDSNDRYVIKISFIDGDEYLVEYPRSSSVSPETIQDACQSLVDRSDFESFSAIDFIDTVMNSFRFKWWRYVDTYNIVI